ncbi:MAG: glycosyltransferase [Candidatus Omnitrophota bacterium]
MKKVLLLYISEDSGHHCASMAIESALKNMDPSVETVNINSFNYTNPILEKVINRTYMSVVRRTPELWDYLYDNPKVVKRTQGLREMIHRFNTGKLKALLDEFRPDAIVCTQAFPCGMIADYKKSLNLSVPLVGVLTDFAPHSYWIYNNVDRYVVPSEETGKKLVDNGIDPGRVAPFGIPIDPKFSSSRATKDEIRKAMSIDGGKPCILIMGGTQGLGPIRELVKNLDRSSLDIQAIVAAGTNKKLYRRLKRWEGGLKKKVIILPFATNVDELMEISDIIVTKPGGITTAEALAKGLPMLIVNPLPGQEAMNTKYLLRNGVALKSETSSEAIVLLEELYYNRGILNRMREKARRLSKPASSIDTARLILELMRS